MTEGGFYQTRGTNPKAVAVVVLLHGAALTALIMAKGEAIVRFPPPTVVRSIPLDKPPHEKPKPQPQPPTSDSRIDTPIPIVPPPPTGTVPSLPTIPDVPPLPPGPVFAKVDRIPVPPPPALTIEPARARADLHSYVSNADYPDAAIRNEEQGTTRFRLLVGANGKVVDCAVTGSSGSSALDSATCRLMKTRARFTPAHDSSGNPTTDNVASAIRWVLPDG
jgi:protein TonB